MDMDMVMVMVMVAAMATQWAITTMARRRDGTTGARLAGAAWDARPACGNRAAADARSAMPARRRPQPGGAFLQMPSRSRTRPAITAVVTPTGQNACIGIGLMAVIGMSISTFVPPISRRAS